ncbi:beta-1,3-galactosyl-O-glycosyl-glycoprotein beta-1,6-N-acetylglucosaminyltransferase-like [Argopecten irradians]|uniref:beta-1,3-galactosyl-O-glycosyl-glycoprotein beta-1,6-N-acetylglucosaminyltransferase-like n=1 Tax=Argopecten irradians TaxID=31199 RepID=UPI00371B4F56
MNVTDTRIVNILTKDFAHHFLSYEYYRNLTGNCSVFVSHRQYITNHLTVEEKLFPIAYSILVYRDLEQVERLLRAIYRPQNFYCIHVDLKTEPSFRDTLSSITKCFDNVFITNTSVAVRWGTFSVLEPELMCMKELWKYTSWKYFINLTGQEFPLRTNAELVKILKVYNGANEVGGYLDKKNYDRWKKAGEAPAGIRPMKGPVHITVSRDFVDFVLHNKTAKQFLEWCKKTRMPDETFFSSLNHNTNLGIKGSYNGTVRPFMTRFKNWKWQPWHCYGKFVRTICIFGVRDLPLLGQRPELFANKFHLDFEPLALDCLEEMIYNKTRDGSGQNSFFDTSLYEKLSFVQNLMNRI